MIGTTRQPFRHLRDLMVEALGIDLRDEIELEQRLRHVRSTATICITFGLAFAFFNVINPGTQLLGFVELGCVLFFFSPAALLLNRPQHIDQAERFLLLGALVISSALIILGGVGGTGIFWVYSVPFLAFFIKGQRRGWYYSLAFFAFHIVCVTLVAPHLPQAYAYPPEVRLHFLLSMGFYVLVAAAFNHARSRFEMELYLRNHEAQAASQAKSRFLAAASHDLRQPAHALGLFVARLKQLAHDGQTQELVAGVDASVQALQDMLDAFFDYSRLDAQLTRANLRDVDLNSVFDQLRTSFSDTAAQKGLRLRVRATPVWVRSDPLLLHRVLLNLLSNALQHTHEGAVMLVCRPSCEQGYVRIQVRDSGIGIAQQHQQKVFEEFYQVENPERDRSKGLGMGLSIVQRSCKLLNHPVGLRSSLGRGSTFTLQVPLGQPQGEGPVAQQEPLGFQDLQGLRVLLIEDDPLGRAALRGLLQSWGCCVTDACTAQAAMDLWNRQRPPHFIVTDYRLLGAHNGVEAVHLLRQMAGHDVAACVISGDADAEVRNQVNAAGLTLLQKPAKPAKLRNLLRHFWNAKAVPAETV